MINLTNVSVAQLSVTEARSAIVPLMIYIAGVVAYSVFIFSFYRFLSRKDIFKIDLEKYSKNFFGALEKFFSVLFYVLKYLVLFPVFIFFWFAIISLIFIVLSDKYDVGQIMLMSMTLVASIRITAYYNEDLSKDLAKMFPFALLAVFLLDISVFSYDTFIAQLRVIPGLWKIMVYYLGFTMIMELVLRIVSSFLKLFIKKEE